MLTFYHDLGRIIYFGSLSKDKSALNDIVILDPQWLVDVFKQVIRFGKPKDMVTYSVKYPEWLSDYFDIHKVDSFGWRIVLGITDKSASYHIDAS